MIGRAQGRGSRRERGGSTRRKSSVLIPQWTSMNICDCFPSRSVGKSLIYLIRPDPLQIIEGDDVNEIPSAWLSLKKWNEGRKHTPPTFRIRDWSRQVKSPGERIMDDEEGDIT